MKNTNVLLLGANGFVGSAFARYLGRHGVSFIGVTRQNYEEYLGCRAELLINAAGNSKKFLAKKKPMRGFEREVVSTMHSLFDFRCGRYLYLSSIDVYDDYAHTQHNHEAVEPAPSQLSEYGLFKYMSELHVRKFAPSWLILRLGGMVGEGLKKNSVYDLMHGEKVWVHPDSAYQYIATDAVAEIAMALVDGGTEGEVFNICGAGVISLRDIAEQLLGVSVDEYTWGESREYYEVNIEKISRLQKIGATREYVRGYLEEHEPEMERLHG